MPRKHKNPNLRIVGSETPPDRKGALGTKSERAKLLQLVEQMMLDGHRIDRIYQVVGAPWSDSKPLPPVTMNRLRQMMVEVEQLWAEDAKSARAQNRQKSINRCIRHMREAQKLGRWNAVCQFEDMIARLQGLYEPERVTVSFQASENVAAILTSLTDDDVRRMAEAQMEIHHKARQYDRAIDTIGEPMPAALPEKASSSEG